MIRTTLAFSLALALAASSQAALIITGNTSGNPAVNLPTHTTYNITATSSVATDKIIGFDFVGGGGAYGITGAMNQVNPAGASTVFNDNNAFFAFVPGSDVSQDSQFKVKSTDGIAITPSESASSLKAAFSLLPAGVGTASNVWNFVQVVLPNGGVGQAVGTLTVRNAQGEDRLESVNFPIGVPEPASLTLLGLAVAAGFGIRRR